MYKNIFLILICNFFLLVGSNFLTQNNSNFTQRSPKNQIDSLKLEFQLFQKKHNSDIHELKTDLEKKKLFQDSLAKVSELKYKKQLSDFKTESQKNNANLNHGQEELDASNKKFVSFFIITALITILIIIFLLYLVKRLITLNALLNNLEDENKIQRDQIVQLISISGENLALAIEKIETWNSKKTPTDHSMVIEFAKHITTIENNMSRMDVNDRGLIRIKRAIDNIYNSLKIMNYEIIPLIGTELSEGQIIEIDIRTPDESVEMGKKIIFNVIKAEILYEGIQIQRAKVDIKYNPNN